MATFITFVISFGCGYVVINSIHNLYNLINEKNQVRSNTYVIAQSKDYK